MWSGSQLDSLEAFLTGDEVDSRDAVAAELREYGVDLDKFSARVREIVRDAYCDQVRQSGNEQHEEQSLCVC